MSLWGERSWLGGQLDALGSLATTSMAPPERPEPVAPLGPMQGYDGKYGIADNGAGYLEVVDAKQSAAPTSTSALDTMLGGTGLPDHDVWFLGRKAFDHGEALRRERSFWRRVLLVVRFTASLLRFLDERTA